MQMLDCLEIQQCMTGFTTTRLLCYRRMNIRELERENNLFFSISVHVYVYAFSCCVRGLLWALMLVAAIASLNK